MTGMDLSLRRNFPDFAMHFIDDGSSVVGVLRCNACGWPADRYPCWKVGETAKSLGDQIKAITEYAGNVVEKSPDYVDAMTLAGDRLYNVPFNSEEDNGDATRAFAEFIRVAQQHKENKMPPATLFVCVWCCPDSPA